MSTVTQTQSQQTRTQTIDQERQEANKVSRILPRSLKTEQRVGVPSGQRRFITRFQKNENFPVILPAEEAIDFKVQKTSPKMVNLKLSEKTKDTIFEHCAVRGLNQTYNKPKDVVWPQPNTTYKTLGKDKYIKYSSTQEITKHNLTHGYGGSSYIGVKPTLIDLPMNREDKYLLQGRDEISLRPIPNYRPLQINSQGGLYGQNKRDYNAELVIKNRIKLI